MYFLFDTNVLLFYLRENDRCKEITRTHNPFGVGNTPILSIVSVGEVESIALRNHWGTTNYYKVSEGTISPTFAILN